MLSARAARALPLPWLRGALGPRQHSSATGLVGSSYLIPTVRLARGDSPETVAEALKHKGNFFGQQAPVVLDLVNVKHDGSPHWTPPSAAEFDGFLKALREASLTPIAVTNASEGLQALAAAHSLGSVIASGSAPASEASPPRRTPPPPAAADPKPAPKPAAAPPKRAPPPAAVPAAPAGSMVHSGSVRSGEQLYADGGRSLVVVGNVSSGAEVMADGDIFIYGKLVGRALAGLAGGEAHVFVLDFQAELVSIDKLFATCEALEQLGDVERGAPTHVRIEDGRLVFQSFKTGLHL